MLRLTVEGIAVTGGTIPDIDWIREPLCSQYRAP